ncbi:alpha-galactosidase [Paenibacillus gansuensis]|uniref:Alpha-galactosidase n=1 Tax=Paenibacillus gansuensis TaxID=306542 RepID=A0ABW5PKS5_9BACL
MLKSQQTRCTYDPAKASLTNGVIQIDFDNEKNTWTASWQGEPRLMQAGFAFEANGERWNHTQAEQQPEAQPAVQQTADDVYGEGIRCTVTYSYANGLNAAMEWSLYDNLPYFFLQLSVSSPDGVSTRYLAPLVLNSSDGARFGMKLERTAKALYIPYDNDMYETYGTYTIAAARESSEAGGIIDPLNGPGLILGSVTHDVWKSGVAIEGMNNELRHLSLFSGMASVTTRDTQPHGLLQGESVASARMFVGFFEDYRDGLEAYGAANAAVVPALPWNEGVPFGWNSWAAVGTKLDYEVYTGASDFLKEQLQPHGYGAGSEVYINFDAFWSNLSKEELSEAVRHVKSNGQKPGIYWTPFSYWWRDLDRVLTSGTETWTVRDILLKGEDGEPLPPIDGGIPMDATHPYVLGEIDRMMDQFAEWGFDYVKLDFLTHGAQEGVRFDKSVPTGTAAYNAAMKRMADRISPERIGRPFFINLSIAPLFPYCFAHSRRISCDAFGHIDDTAYMLNSLTYGWWINDNLYRFNDPDHTVLYESFNAGPSSEEEAFSRYLASVITGTVMMAGDDFRKPEARDRAARLLTNPLLNDIAAKGRSFRPLLTDAGEGASDMFMLMESDGSMYLAVFNYSAVNAAVKVLPVSTLGLTEGAAYTLQDLVSGTVDSLSADYQIILRPAESRIFHIRTAGL